jgi:hypothetical protein
VARWPAPGVEIELHPDPEPKSHTMRTLILIAIAFVAGMVYERNRAAERCADRAGVLSDLLCKGTP